MSDRNRIDRAGRQQSHRAEALLEGLADQALQEGEIFKQATLERMGFNGATICRPRSVWCSIDTEIEDLPRNRVNIKIDIEEGKSSNPAYKLSSAIVHLTRLSLIP